MKHINQIQKILQTHLNVTSGMETAANEYTILASCSNPEEAQAMHKERWTIENLFGNMKTKGFNLESTHMNDDEKLKKLIEVITIAKCLHLLVFYFNFKLLF